MVRIFSRIELLLKPSSYARFQKALAFYILAYICRSVNHVPFFHARVLCSICDASLNQHHLVIILRCKINLNSSYPQTSLIVPRIVEALYNRLRVAYQR